MSSCKSCSRFKIERNYTGDSFEMAFDWFCMEVKDSGEKGEHPRKIIGYMEAFDKDPGIPKWCPLLSAEAIIEEFLKNESLNSGFIVKFKEQLDKKNVIG